MRLALKKLGVCMRRCWVIPLMISVPLGANVLPVGVDRTYDEAQENDVLRKAGAAWTVKCWEEVLELLP